MNIEVKRTQSDTIHRIQALRKRIPDEHIFAAVAFMKSIKGRPDMVPQPGETKEGWKARVATLFYANESSRLAMDRGTFVTICANKSGCDQSEAIKIEAGMLYDKFAGDFEIRKEEMEFYKTLIKKNHVVTVMEELEVRFPGAFKGISVAYQHAFCEEDQIRIVSLLKSLLDEIIVVFKHTGLKAVYGEDDDWEDVEDDEVVDMPIWGLDKGDEDIDIVNNADVNVPEVPFKDVKVVEDQGVGESHVLLNNKRDVVVCEDSGKKRYVTSKKLLAVSSFRNWYLYNYKGTEIYVTDDGFAGEDEEPQKQPRERNRGRVWRVPRVIRDAYNKLGIVPGAEWFLHQLNRTVSFRYLERVGLFRDKQKEVDKKHNVVHKRAAHYEPTCTRLSDQVMDIQPGIVDDKLLEKCAGLIRTHKGYGHVVGAQQLGLPDDCWPVFEQEYHDKFNEVNYGHNRKPRRIVSQALRAGNTISDVYELLGASVNYQGNMLHYHLASIITQLHSNMRLLRDADGQWKFEFTSN
jgi:hypothetical protein